MSFQFEQMQSVNSSITVMRVLLWQFLIFYLFNCECSAENFSNSKVEFSSDRELKGETWTATTINHLNPLQNWSQLLFEDQRKLLEYDVEFQGTKIPLKYVFAADFKSLEFLQISDVLSHKFKIGADIKFNGSYCYDKNRFLLNRTTNEYRHKFFRHEYEEVGMDTIIAAARTNKGIYLSDVPEREISNFSKALAQQLKKKWPWYWIVSLDLQSADNIPENFESQKEISEYISKNFLNLTNFEEKTFQDIFTTNRVIFLVKLLEDINIENKQINLLNAIKRKSDNQLWIFSSLRKLDIASLLGMRVYRQLPIEENDYKIWKPSRNPWTDRVKGPKAKDRNKWIFILSAWANITIENSTNCDDGDTDYSDKTLFGIFKKYIDIILSSIEYPPLTVKNIESIYQNRALKILFPDYHQKHLVKLWFPDLPSVPFKKINANRTYRLVSQKHVVVAKFFVVDFFRQRLFASDKNVTHSIPNTLKAILTNRDHYRKVHGFLEDVYLLLFADTQTEALKRAIEYFRHFYTTTELQAVLSHAVYLGDINTVKLLTKIVENIPEKLIELVNYKGGLVNCAAEYQSGDFMESLLKLLRDQFTADSYKNLFFQKDIYGRNPIFLSAKRIDNFDFLLNHPIVPLNDKEKAKFLVELDTEGNDILYELKGFTRIQSFLNTFKAMGQRLDKESALQLLDAGTLFDNFGFVDFDLVGPEFFDVLVHWSQTYALNNITKKVFFTNNFQYLKYDLFRSANIFVLQAFWTFFDTIYRSNSEKKDFLGDYVEIFRNSMHNSNEKVFSFVKSKYDQVFGPQKSKHVIWKLMSNSIYNYYRIEEIDFYWPFFEQIYRSHEERRAKLKEKDNFHTTLLYRAKEVSSDKYPFIWAKYAEMLNKDEMERAQIKESDLPWYKKFLIYLGFSS